MPDSENNSKDDLLDAIENTARLTAKALTQQAKNSLLDLLCEQYGTAKTRGCTVPEIEAAMERGRQKGEKEVAHELEVRNRMRRSQS